MAELRVREVVKDEKTGKPVTKYIKTKSRAARRAAFEKQVGHKFTVPKGKGAKKDEKK